MFKTVDSIIRNDDRAILLMADIGAIAFSDLSREFPNRVINFGICEDGMVGMAAGMALKGMYPIIYGITPFIAERALEQLKLNFAYQKLGGVFITTGAAYDFSTLGYSHYSASDAIIIKQLHEMDFIAPGTPAQMISLLNETYNNGRPTFIRMSDYCNITDCVVKYAKATVIKEGSKAVIVVVSTMLDVVLDALGNEDVTILYYSTLAPFDSKTLKKYLYTGKILVCEPESEGTLANDILKAAEGNPISYMCVGVPNEILRTYGTKKEKDISLGLTSENVKKTYNKLIKEH